MSLKKAQLNCGNDFSCRNILKTEKKKDTTDRINAQKKAPQTLLIQFFAWMRIPWQVDQALKQFTMGADWLARIVSTVVE